MKRITTTVFLLALAAPAFAGGNIAAGEAKAKEVCAACHGPEGNAPISPDFPKLAGQKADYLERALHDYKSGARKNAIMAGQAQALSEQDIENLAARLGIQIASRLIG